MDMYFERFGGVRDYLRMSSSRPVAMATPRPCSAGGATSRPDQRQSTAPRDGRADGLECPDPGLRC